MARRYHKRRLWNSTVVPTPSLLSLSALQLGIRKLSNSYLVAQFLRAFHGCTKLMIRASSLASRFEPPNASIGAQDPHQVHRIHPLPVQFQAPMQVRPGNPPGSPHLAEHRSRLHLVARPHANLR